MEFLSGRLWLKIQPALKTAREVLVTTWNIEPEALLALAEAAPKARIRLVIDRITAPYPFTGTEYKEVRDRLGDRVEIRENKGSRVLHAKVLIIRGPSDLAIVGSSNLTGPGLGCYKPGNIEASVLLEPGPAFNDIVAWFEQVFLEKGGYLQLSDSMIRLAYPSTEIAQRLIAEEKHDGQEVQKDASDEDTLSTTSDGIEGFAKRVNDGMKEPPRPLRDYQQAILQTLDQSW